jgi:predicted secreted protein
MLALTLVHASLWAGDIAGFVDLGFSPDGKNYLFAQYGVESATLKPWAELYLVDVPRNDFVKGGKLSYIHSDPVVAGQDGSGALYRLVARNAALAERFHIDYLRQSQPLYISLETGSTPAGESLVDFRDFEAGASYSAVLVPYVEGSGGELRSSFYINVERTAKDGTKKKYVVGTPGVKRPLVTAYRIHKAVIAPRDGSLIFVIEMYKKAASGHDLRYMVEALRL